MSFEWNPTQAARKIPAKEQGNRGVFPSIKVSGETVEYESSLERDFFLVCHHSPDVIKFQHQPVTITYQDARDKARKYTPDVYVEFTNGNKFLFEIKYEADLTEKKEFYEQRWEKAREWAKERKIGFEVISERVIRAPRWFNIWFTIGASKSHSSDAYVPKLIALIPDEGERYDQLCFLLAEKEGLAINKAAQVLCYAIYHGLVFVDTFCTSPIVNGTIVRVKKRGNNCAFRPLLEELGLSNSPGEKLAENSPLIENPVNQDTLPLSISLSLPEKYEQSTRSKITAVNAWLNQPKRKRTPEWRRQFCSKYEVGEKTIYRWVAGFRADGVEGLIPKYQRSGRKSVFTGTVAELMEVARQSYLAPLRTLKTAYAELTRSCQEKELPVPSEQSFRTFIYRTTTAADFAKKRGKTFQKANFTPALASFQGAVAPMQVVQIDNTSFDVFPVDSEFRESLSPPNLTAAIDCYTRMITGFNLSYFPCSSRSVLEVLVQTILPKENHTNANGTQQVWPIQGFPVLILVDNGLDFRSEAVKKFCVEYDVILEYVPIRTPRFKAFIEQWFNVIHNALGSEQVSGFRPQLKKRMENPQLKPDAEAVLTLQELEDWVYNWVVDEYHFTNPYEDHAPAPYLRWQDFQGGQTNPLLPLPREPPAGKNEVELLYLAMLEHVERTLGYQGIAWEHLRYNNRQLTRLYRTIGNEKVGVLLNPRDIRNIWVTHPSEAKPIKVELASGWAQVIARVYGDRPIHASAWKKDLSALKDKFRRKMSPFLYQREMSRVQREGLVQEALKATKTARKENEKAKETARKSPDREVQPASNPVMDGNISDNAEEEPARKKKKVEIDWNNLKNFPTYDFPKDR
jgi:putative transposase